MPNLRVLAESDLGTTLEGDFALPVELIDPEGAEQSLMGQVLYDTTSLDPDTGEAITVNNPIVTLRRSTLTRIPQDGETWLVRIPITPSLTAPMDEFIASGVHSSGGGASIGYIKLHLTRAEQI